MTRVRHSLYQSTGQGMLRAAMHLTPPDMPRWPGRAAPAGQWRAWLAAVWADDDFRRAVSGASPVLAEQVQAILNGRTPKLRRMRRAALATARYAIRYARRSTPYGLFAGVTLAGFGTSTHVRFGDRHQAVSRPDPVALDAAVSAWETDSTHMAGVDLRLNTLACERDGHLIVPSEGDAAFRIALSPAVRFVADTARSPIRYSALANKLAAEMPDTSDHDRAALLGNLLRVRLLRSSLRAPATVTDPGDAVPPAVRDAASARPAATDVRLDATVRLPQAVMTEAESTATVLARLAMHPNGIPAWRRWTKEFAERYGEMVDIPLDVAIDPGRGVGLPDGFGKVSAPPRPMTRRDRVLLEWAGTAAAEGTCSVPLTGAMIEEAETAAGKPTLTAPHMDLGARIQSPSVAALDQGNFRLQVITASRSAGSMTGRFWHLFPDTGATYSGLPTVEPGAELVQLSFHAGRTSADLLTRAPRVLPRLVSVGEFRRNEEGVLFPSDLSVGVRAGRPYLTETRTGRRLELLAPTALNFLWNHYTPPLARFLVEISRATAPQVTWFDWGAAWTLPFTPALTYRRSILVPARWKVRARDLPGRTAALEEWAQALHAWACRFRLPNRVLLAEDDQYLPLDLRDGMHLDLLRAHLDARPSGVATVYEAPPPDADGWIGGRAHDLVLPLAARS